MRSVTVKKKNFSAGGSEIAFADWSFGRRNH